LRWIRAAVVAIALSTAIQNDAFAVTTSANEMKAEISFDWSMSIPLGMSWGCAWSHFPGFEIMGIASMIEFKTNSPYDEIESYGIMPNRGTFFSYGFGPRLVYSHYVDTPRGTMKERYFVGYVWRDFLGMGRTGDALECLYCSDWSLTCEYPMNSYLIVGVHHGNTQLTFEYRVSNETGISIYSGSDPYGLGDSWYEEWPELGAPAWILQIGHVWNIEY
jgi:hypothetical protein